LAACDRFVQKWKNKFRFYFSRVAEIIFSEAIIPKLFVVTGLPLKSKLTLKKG